MNILWLRRSCWALVVVLMFAAAWLHFAGRINLLTADLGRHLVNGREFFASHLILTTNYYSYTNPDFLALCHHWGIGPFFYACWQAWGFSGLSAVYTGILWATLVLAVFTARRSAGNGAVVLAGMLALPLAAYRIEIRPEGVSTLFLMIEYFLLSEWRAGRVRGAWLWVIVLLQVVWVNVHILFFSGLVLTGVYWLDARLSFAPADNRCRTINWIFGGALLASLVNPFTFFGLSQPLSIFQGYGYDLVENQTIFFMLRRFPGNQVYGYFLMLFLASLLLLVARWSRDGGWRKVLPQALLWLFFGLMAVKSVRAIAMFSFIFIPVVAESLETLLRHKRQWRRLAGWTGVGLVFLAVAWPSSLWSPVGKFAPYVAEERHKKAFFYILARPDIWSGLMPGVERSADFFKSAGLKGPVFNNYDIGGYFIFYLFPQERPFVDNRPEAYPVDFFKRTYSPMQEQEAVWQAQAQKHGFELIYFYRHDITPWAQPFLLRRLDDPQWAPVFVDDYTLILARRGGVNQAVIGRHELPRAMFKKTTN
ncbi:MAG: hypothetical protein HQL20_03380 [Candidatus Omnitrophica bacterium]|nr:hypothetical protein [Candidatus Omnitrophota bacterium]